MWHLPSFHIPWVGLSLKSWQTNRALESAYSCGIFIQWRQGFLCAEPVCGSQQRTVPTFPDA
jgi:hypothetical protein